MLFLNLNQSNLYKYITYSISQINENMKLVIYATGNSNLVATLLTTLVHMI